MCTYVYRGTHAQYKDFFFWGGINKKADLSHFFLSHPGQLTLCISGSPDLQYFPFWWGETRQKSCHWDHCFSMLCSELLNSDEHELLTGALPTLLNLAGFPESAHLPAKLISQSILFLCCELLCWDLKCSELFLLDKRKYWNDEVLAGCRLCQLNTSLCLTDKTIFKILVLLC